MTSASIARVRCRLNAPLMMPSWRDSAVTQSESAVNSGMMVAGSTMAGKPVPNALLIDVDAVIDAFYTERPDPGLPAERVVFGTSGHRGASLTRSFNQDHLLAVTQAVCDYRHAQGIDGPLFIGKDTHALSEPAYLTALEVLSANGVDVMLPSDGPYTPTPAISHAILRHNRTEKSALADGIVMTPSHNPPASGGFKYNPPTGGPADAATTRWIERRANDLLQQALQGVKRVALDKALRADTTHHYDYMTAYVDDLDQVIDLAAIRASGVRVGVDPLGGAGVHYWPAIAERFDLALDIISAVVDPTFGFMSLDWDGQVRMDPSSASAMQRLIPLRGCYDVALACDPDHDRHGIVVPEEGLLPSNHYLAVAVDYLFRRRANWGATAAVGKTLVSSARIDQVAASVNRRVVDVPVGFKWFVPGLLDGSLGFAGEESAGATFARLDGRVWTTDKDGIVAGLLAAEMTAHSGRDPGERHRALVERLGPSAYDRVETPATDAEKTVLARLGAEDIRTSTLAGDPIVAILTLAPGNGAPIGGVKVTTPQGWFAVRPSGTEDLYKLYAESFQGAEHLQRIIQEARDLMADALVAGRPTKPNRIEARP